MITKDRLEELIKQGATIWTKDLHFLELNKNDCFMNSKNLLQFGNFHYTNDYLFETEEDAHWELEMTATKTETLKLPKFEELAKELDVISFIRYNEEMESLVLYELYTHNNEICVLFRELYDDASDCLFRQPLTKENYIKACKLCLKLFKGERDESVCNKK